MMKRGMVVMHVKHIFAEGFLVAVQAGAFGIWNKLTQPKEVFPCKDVRTEPYKRP